METKIYYHDRTEKKWPAGEWDGEPDKMQWPDEVTGLPCLIVRGPMGALCGYVGVADGHMLYGKEYGANKVFSCDDVCDDGEDSYHYACSPQSHLHVHGGITFSDFCAETTDESKHICHVAAHGEPARVWWFGFDCGHHGDWSPIDAKYEVERGGCFARSGGSVYRTIDYVKHECSQLAKQLAEIAK